MVTNELCITKVFLNINDQLQTFVLGLYGE